MEIDYQFRRIIKGKANIIYFVIPGLILIRLVFIIYYMYCCPALLFLIELHNKVFIG